VMPAMAKVCEGTMNLALVTFTSSKLKNVFSSTCASP